MPKTVIETAVTVAVIAGVGVLVHYVGGLDWPWAILIGAVASLPLRRLLNRGGPTSHGDDARAGRG